MRGTPAKLKLCTAVYIRRAMQSHTAGMELFGSNQITAMAAENASHRQPSPPSAGGNGRESN